MYLTSFPAITSATIASDCLGQFWGVGTPCLSCPWSSGSSLVKGGEGSCPVLFFLPGTTSLATSLGSVHPDHLSLVFFIQYCKVSLDSNFHATLTVYPFFSGNLCLILLQFFKHKMKMMVSRIETEQFIKQSLSCTWPVGRCHLSWFFSSGETVFPPIFTTEPGKSCASCTAGFATVAAEQWVIIAKDEKIGWFVLIWTGGSKLWWDPKTWFGLQGGQDQTPHLIIYKVLK